MQGYLDGLDENNDVESWMTTNGTAWLDALNTALGVHSPSTITEQSGVDTMQGYINGVDGMEGSVSSTMVSAANAAITAFQTQMSQSKFYTFGVNAMQGAINGIKAMQSSLVAAASAAGTAAANAYKAAQNINSPSKLFYWFSEMDIQGAIQGLEDNQGKVNAAFEEAAEANAFAYQSGAAQQTTYAALAPWAAAELTARASSLDAAMGTGGVTYVINFSPVYNLEGASTPDAVRETLAQHDENLKDYILEVLEEAGIDATRRRFT
jgi:hypothetical protein